MPEKRIRLLVDAHCFDSEYQGSRTFLLGIYSVLAKKENLLLFIAAHDVQKARSGFPPAGNIVYLRYRSRSSLVRLTYEIPVLIKKHKIDFAHFQYITPFKKNCRQIVTIHDVLFNDYTGEFPFLYRLLRKRLFQRSVQTADVLTTVSAYSKAAIQKHLKTGTKKLHLIPNGVNPVYFSSYDKLQAKSSIKEKYGLQNFILYVSRIEPRKNHLGLLKAFLELKLYANNYHLVFIGAASLRVPQLQTLLSTLPNEVRAFVFIREQVDEAELLQFYRAADVFVYPSKAEGFGIPPLEAGAAGVPVICSNTTAMQDYPFFRPYHIDPNDPVQLKETLAQAIRSKHDQTKLDSIADTIQCRYSWEAVAEKLYQLLLSDRIESNDQIKKRAVSQASITA